MKRNIIYIIPLLLLLTSCVVTDIDRTVNFQQFRKFSWTQPEVTVSHPLYKSDLIEKRVKQKVTSEFAKMGIVESANDPDFLVKYTIFTEKKEQMRNNYISPFFYGPFGYFPYSFRYWGPYGLGGYPAQPVTYTEGNLVLDIIDADTQETVWRGSVSGNVDNVKTLQKQIDKAVKVILKKYPGRPAGDEPSLLPEKSPVS